MDYSNGDSGFQDESPRRRQLPSDLPTSLDDRRRTPVFGEETEIYDAWQGQSQFLTTPVPAKPVDFNLKLADPSYGDEHTVHDLEDSDSRLVQMLASQARLKEDHSADGGEDEVIADESLSREQKSTVFQSQLTMAASNGVVGRVRRLLTGKAKPFIDINMPDAEGTPPLIYASCFGHEEAVAALIDAGADVDIQDKNKWSALMWAMTNRHKTIAKLLLDNGANPDIQSSSGRTAFDFVAPNSEISDYLYDSGYKIGNAGVSDDFYDSGFGQGRFEEEMAENEMKRRMMMESAINLEVDLGNLGLDEKPDSPEEFEEGQEFAWDRCQHDQMFVFQESELDRMLDIVITNMTPQRSASQKPVPANVLFLSARYAHYHASPDLLEKLFVAAMNKINEKVEKHQWDMTILAFWLTNATLLLYYLKKDTGLVTVTTRFQAQIAELINEIYILIIRDAERRMDKVLDGAILDHETIPGFEDVTFQNEWKIFKRKKVQVPEPIEKRWRPPSPKRRMAPSPRQVTSLLSSTLFVLDLYDIHSIITSQILSQLLYWLGAEIFNRIMENRKYLARTKAMQIRMNVSTLEDWARSNARQPEHYENGSLTATGESTVDTARRHLAPVVQLLQWLQCFSSLGEDNDSLKATLEQLPRLTQQQLIHAVKHYRAEVGEKGLPKPAMKHLIDLQKQAEGRRKRPRQTPGTPTKGIDPSTPSPTDSKFSALPNEEDEPPEHLLMDPALMLPFSLPTSTDMLVSYGAGFGGTDRERERRYIPTLPPEFIEKLNLGGKSGSGIYPNGQWSDEDTG